MIKPIPFLFAAAALGLTGLAPAAEARPQGDRGQARAAEAREARARPDRGPDRERRARPRRDREQDAAYRARQAGRIMSLRTIESRVMPRMRGAEYLGPELDAGSGTYRLKFMRGGRVIWIDVDARTGRVLGKSGN